MWGIRPHGAYGTTSWHKGPPPSLPIGRSGISRKRCAFLAAYAASYTQSVLPWLCLPPPLEVRSRNAARSFRWWILTAHAAIRGAVCRSAGDSCKVASCRRSRGLCPRSPPGSSPGKAGNARAPAPRQPLSCWHPIAKEKRHRNEKRHGRVKRQAAVNTGKGDSQEKQARKEARKEKRVNNARLYHYYFAFLFP